jgi:hypothetical protein
MANGSFLLPVKDRTEKCQWDELKSFQRYCTIYGCLYTCALKHAFTHIVPHNIDRFAVH